MRTTTKYRPAPPPAVYVLEDVATGQYLNTEGERVTLAPLARATRRPATAAGREEIQQIASGLNVAAEIQRVEEVAA